MTARFIAGRVLENREAGSPLKQQAVLFRASHHSGPLEIELTRRNIPFVKFGGLKFLDAAHIKDLLALLRFVENPRDKVSGFRVMQLLPGVGPTSAQRVLDHIAAATDPMAALSSAPPPPRAGDDWAGFLGAIAELRSGRAGWPAEIERARLWYEPHLERVYEDASTRQADLVQLEQIAGGYPSRERFLTELSRPERHAAFRRRCRWRGKDGNARGRQEEAASAAQGAALARAIGRLGTVTIPATTWKGGS